MSKRRKRLLLLTIVLLLAGGWIWRYVALNTFYGSLYETARHTYSMGEAVPIGDSGTKYGLNAPGYSIRVDQFAILDLSEFLEQIYASEEELQTVPDRVAVVYATLFNEDSQAPGVDLAGVWLHGIDNYAMVDLRLVELANPPLKGKGTSDLSLPQGTEHSVVLPFALYEQYFGGDTWRDLDRYSFCLCLFNPSGEKDILCWLEEEAVCSAGSSR